MNECCCIQNHLKSAHPGSDSSQDAARLFDHLLSKGKVGTALRLLRATHEGGVLPLDSLVPSGFDSSGSQLFKTTNPVGKPSPGKGCYSRFLLDPSVETPCFDLILLIHWMPV